MTCNIHSKLFNTVSKFFISPTDASLLKFTAIHFISLIMPGSIFHNKLSHLPNEEEGTIESDTARQWRVINT